MATTPWAIIKLCLPCWLIESAPYKQAFLFFLAILSPTLLLSPFLLSPLLTLLLLSSATVAGALSAWITIKASRTVLTHTSPLCLPLTLSSCFKALAQVIGFQNFGSVMVTNKFPWTWLWFVKIPANPELSDVAIIEERGAPLEISTRAGCHDEEKDLQKRKDSDAVSSGELQIEEKEASVEPVSDKQILSEVRKITLAAPEKKENLGVVEFGRRGSGSVYLRGALLGSKGLRPQKDGIYFSQGPQEHLRDSSANFSSKETLGESEINQKGNKSEGGGMVVGGEFQIISKLEVLSGLSGIKTDEDRDYSALLGKSGLRRLPRKVEPVVGPMKFISQDDQGIDVGPKETTVEAKVCKGCASHSWCQKGLNFEEELGLLVEDIHTVCLGKWYPSLSSNEAFPSTLKMLLGICVRHAASSGGGSDVLPLAVKLASLFLCHLREFRKARRKKRAAEAMASSGKETEVKKSKCRISVENVASEEETLSISLGKSESSIQSAQDRLSHTSQLKESGSMLVQEDASRSPSGKGVMIVEGGDDKKSQEGLSHFPIPQSGSPSPKVATHSALTKQNFSIDGHLGEEAYYRLRFGHSRVNKDIPGHYLINLSMHIIRDVVSMVGKLPIDPSEKLCFRNYGSSHADSPPGKILVSMIARKVLLPLVETVSDPEWLNSRIATLLVDHAGAKVHVDSSDETEESRLFFTKVVHRGVNVESNDGMGGFSSDETRSVTFKTEGYEEICMRSEETGSREERRKSLSLPLEISCSSVSNPIDGRISSVLGGIISATAGPLLPDNVGVSYKPIKRMWSSPSVEEGKELDGEPEFKKKVRPFGRNIIDGLPVDSKTPPEGAVATSAQGVQYTANDKGQLGTLSLSAQKGFRGTPQKQANISLSARKPPKKKFLSLPFGSQQSTGTLPHSGLFRSKSSHDVQAANDEIWHIEEGSELHEGAYLSDDPGSPMTLEKETRESSIRKPGRSRSFHGVKNYNRQRESDKDKLSWELRSSEREVGKVDAEGYLKDNSEIPLKGENTTLSVPSENSMGEESDKVFQEGSLDLDEGFGTRWVRYALGKRSTQGSSEAESDDLDRVRSSSCQSSIEKGDKSSVVSSGGSFSEGCVSPDIFRIDDKFWDTQEGTGKILADKKDVMETRLSSEIDPDVGEGLVVVSPASPSLSTSAVDDDVKEVSKDISPVYEEVEDLPSTIAKLKALLRERNGSRQIGENSPSSMEGMKKEIENFPGLEVTLDQDVSQIPRPQSSPLEERPFSWPSDGGIFLNVKIPYTEICKRTLTSQSSNPLSSSNNPHVFYCIEYDAAYPEEGADAAMVNLAGEDVDGSVEGIGSHVGDRDNKNGLPYLDSTETSPPSPGTMVHHVIVKRRFQEFLVLHAQLEADPLWRQALKGLKGPSRWLNLPFGKTSASTVAGRRTLLQAYLRGVCTSMPQLASRSKALRTFMAYQGTSKPVASGETLPPSVERVLPIAAEGGEGPVPRIDKFFARTVSGMFNTLKTALPGFDSPDTTQQLSGATTSSSSTPLPPSITSSYLDSSSAPAALGETKASSGQSGTIRGTMMQLPAFLQFGNSNAATYPELVDWDMDYGERDPGGNISTSGSIEGLPTKTFSLEEDIQAFLGRLANIPENRDDLAEFAYEALDPFGSYEDSKDFEEQSLRSSSRKALTRQYLVDSADDDGEEEELDAFLPLSKVAIDILCEALRGTGSWVSQGTVVHATKVIIGSIIEQKLQGFLKTITTKEMWCHYVHILRVILFHPPADSSQKEGSSEETGSNHVSGQELAIAIYTAFPLLFRQIVGNQELLEAAKFIADSLQNKVILRELVLQVLHVCIIHLVSTGNKSMAVN